MGTVELELAFGRFWNHCTNPYWALSSRTRSGAKASPAGSITRKMSTRYTDAVLIKGRQLPKRASQTVCQANDKSDDCLQMSNGAALVGVQSSAIESETLEFSLDTAEKLHAAAGAVLCCLSMRPISICMFAS